jgi:thiol-disulfide isomerase/thioredoxin
MAQLSPIHVDTFLRRSAVLAACLGLAIAAGCQRETPPKVEEVATPARSETNKPGVLKATSGREVLNRMVIAYRKASSYADAGTVHLLAEAGDEKVVDETANLSLTLVRPNQIRLQAYSAMVVCDGKKLYASLEDQPGQILEKPAPIRVTLKTLYADRMLTMAMTQGIAGAMPQLALLLGDAPIKSLMADSETAVLSDPGQIDGRDCYRVRIERPEGIVTFWIDQETFLLRRVVLPTDEIRQAISQQRPVDRVSLVAEFPGAQIDGKINPAAFEFEVPAGAEIVKYFIPPNTAQLLSKRVPDFKFSDIDGKPITPESLAGKIAVLDFWATWCAPCRQTLPNLEKVYQKYKDNPKVVFYAVSVDEPKVENQDLVKAMEDWKVQVPILRDTERTAVALKFTGIPIMFIIGPDGVVQDCEVGGNPKLTEVLPEKLDKLLAGENIFEKPMKEYQDQLKQMLEGSADGAPTGGERLVEQRTLPALKTAPRSEPATLKLTPLWKCAEVKSPANILVLDGKNGSPRLAVVESCKSVAEIGLDGKLIALHKLNLAESEVIGSLRSAVGADGKRYTVAFLATQQRCHVLDENWKHVASYPEDALQKPHSGIADVELGDLDGDGKLKMCVSYWGVVGVQGASLEGKRLWTNRSLSNVLSVAIGAPDPKGHRNLYCANISGSLVVLDPEGKRLEEIKIDQRVLHWIAAADLRGDGQLLWCGLAASRLGEDVAVGLSLDGKELWNYPLPLGVQPQPIEPVIPGRITRERPGQWILPGPDGSIHFIAADGKPLDQFNSGVVLQGLATVEIDGQPALVIASANGLEAWKVEQNNAK